MAFKLHVYVSDYVGKEGLNEVLTEVLLFGVPVTTALSTTKIINDKVSIFSEIFWDADTLKHFTLLIHLRSTDSVPGLSPVKQTIPALKELEGTEWN